MEQQQKMSLVPSDFIGNVSSGSAGKRKRNPAATQTFPRGIFPSRASLVINHLISKRAHGIIFNSRAGNFGIRA